MRDSGRNSTIDLMRGVAILLMVAFHFCYDLRFFGYVSWDVPDGTYWRPIRYVILLLFLTCVGYGVVQQNRHQVRWTAFYARLLKIASGALAVSVVSLYLFPGQWIYFGILHLILFASMIALPLRHRPHIALLLAVLFLTIGFGYRTSRTWPFNLLSDYLPGYSVDYVPLLPWLGAVLFGVWLAHNRWFISANHAQRQRAGLWHWLSRHSLMIYLLHQPVLFTLLYAHKAWLR